MLKFLITYSDKTEKYLDNVLTVILNADVDVRPHPCFSWYRPYITAQDLDDLTDKAYGWRGPFFRHRLEE